MSILRGPADADHYRVKVGRYGDRWYADPLPGDSIAPASGETWPSVSTVKKSHGTDWTFVGLKRVAKKLEQNPHELDGLNYQARYDRLKSINRLGLNEAAGRGTDVHTMFEAGLRGQLIASSLIGAEAQQYVPAVEAFFNTHQPELVAAELVCIQRDLNSHGYGGTCDALIRIGGRIYIVDWKSRGEDSDHGAYPEEGAQLAAYWAADYIITDGPQRQSMPEVDGGLIVSIKPDGTRIYPVDLIKAAEHWQALHAWWVARRSERDPIGHPWAPQAVPDPLDQAITTATNRKELEALYVAHKIRWTPAHTQAAKDHLAQLERNAA